MPFFSRRAGERPFRAAIVLAVGGLLAMLARGPSPSVTAPAIIGGSIDASDPAVVAVLKNGEAWCTGTLVGTRAVLTAAHCVPSAGALTVVTGNDGSVGPRREVAGAFVDPEFDPNSFFHDAAVLVLRDAIVDIAFARVADSASASGDRLRVVGFGKTSTDGGADDGRKRTGVSVIQQRTADEYVVAALPTQPCAGDSGGPGFIGPPGQERLAGVVSFGDATCSTGARFARVDPEGNAFIGTAIARAAAGGAGPGDPCFVDDACDRGFCYAPPDAPGRPYCSRSCAADADCRNDMRCDASLRDGASGCAYPLPSPGAESAPCAHDPECSEGLLCSATAGGTKHCAANCYPGVLPCLSGGECASDSTRPGAYACVAPPPPSPASGCSVGRARASVEVPWMALSLVVVAVMKRRARTRGGGGDR